MTQIIKISTFIFLISLINLSCGKENEVDISRFFNENNGIKIIENKVKGNTYISYRYYANLNGSSIVINYNDKFLISSIYIGNNFAIEIHGETYTSIENIKKEFPLNNIKLNKKYTNIYKKRMSKNNKSDATAIYTVSYKIKEINVDYIVVEKNKKVKLLYDNFQENKQEFNINKSFAMYGINKYEANYGIEYSNEYSNKTKLIIGESSFKQLLTFDEFSKLANEKGFQIENYLDLLNKFGFDIDEIINEER